MNHSITLIMRDIKEHGIPTDITKQYLVFSQLDKFCVCSLYTKNSGTIVFRDSQGLYPYEVTHWSLLIPIEDEI